MSEPSQNVMSSSKPMNATFQDTSAFQYPPGGTRRATSQYIGPGTRAMLDQPVNMGKGFAAGDPKPSFAAQGGTFIDLREKRVRKDADMVRV